MLESDDIDKLKKLMASTCPLAQQDFLLYLVLHLNSMHPWTSLQRRAGFSLSKYPKPYTRGAQPFTLLVVLGKCRSDASIPTISLAPLNADPASEQSLLAKHLRPLL